MELDPDDFNNNSKMEEIKDIIEDDKTLTTYEINHNNNMMKTFLSRQSDNVSDWTLKKDGKSPTDMNGSKQEFTK
jgi:hypothetical protein